MDPILESLYEAYKPEFASAEETALIKREESFLDRMEERLGLEDFSRFWDTLSDMGAIRAEEGFALGFRLGVQLTLTAAGPIHEAPGAPSPLHQISR